MRESLADMNEDSDDNSLMSSGNAPLLKESKSISQRLKNKILNSLKLHCKQLLGKSVNFLRKQEVNLANLNRTLSSSNGGRISDFDFIMNDDSHVMFNDMEGREDMIMINIETALIFMVISFSFLDGTLLWTLPPMFLHAPPHLTVETLALLLWQTNMLRYNFKILNS